MIPFLPEMMPAEVRAAAFSLAFSLATAIFSGSPRPSRRLNGGKKAALALWLSLTAAISLVAASIAKTPPQVTKRR